MSLMVSVSGIRGIVGIDLTPHQIVDWVSSFLYVLGSPPGTIIIGRDTRASGSYIQKIVAGTINALGWNSIDIGIAPTPTVLLATRKLKCDGGIVITASHNPAQWNALKFCDSRGLFLTEETIEKIRECSEDQSQRRWSKFDEIGESLVNDKAVELHIKEVLSFLKLDLIQKRRFRVAIDPVGASGTVIDRKFLESLGCEVFGIHEEASGLFPREPEPLPQNLSKLCNIVKKVKADIGFAQDPDADRLSVVADGGVPIGEEYTLVLAGESFLRKKKTDIACNLSTSLMVDDLANRHNVKAFRTKIGEIHVTRALIDKGLLYGGEGNGGAIIPQINPCRDSIVAMGLILDLLAEENSKPLSKIIKEFRSYCMKKDKVTLSDQKLSYSRILQQARKIFSDHSYVTLDGIKIYNSSEWLHIRSSNTEPIVRIVAESPSNQRTKELIEMGKILLAP
jgi:phosphomannomutase